MKTTTATHKIFTVIISLVLSAALGCGGEVFKNLLGGGVARIEISPGSSSIPKGITQQLKATAIYTDGSKQDVTNKCDWSVDDPFVADVTSAGSVLSSWIGSVTVTAQYVGKIATAIVTITDHELISLQISPLSRSMPKGTKYQFSAIGVFTDNITKDLTTDTNMNWTSNDTGIVNIGLHTGLAESSVTTAGSTTIDATWGTTSISASATVNVTNASLTAISISPLEDTIIDDTTRQFKAIAYYSDNTTQDITSQAKWSSDTTSVATIGATTGLATAVGAGNTKITVEFPYTSPQKSANTTLAVETATLDTITITPDNPIAYGTNQQFKAIGHFNNGSEQDITNDVIWSSSDTDVATISNDPLTAGLAISKDSGTTDIEATLLGKTGSTSLEVRLITLTSISIVPASTSLNIGQTLQFFANGTYSDGTIQDLTSQVLWNSSDDSLGEISNATGSQGIATAKATGTVTLSAMRDRVTGTASFTINAADSTPPTITDVKLLSGNRIEVTYSEDVDVSSASNSTNYVVVDSTSGSCSDNSNFIPGNQTSDFTLGTTVVVNSLNQYVLTLAPGTSVKLYTLIADKVDIKDLAGIALGCPNNLSFQGKDTVPPYMLSAISDTPTTVIVKFSEAMNEGGGTTGANNFANYSIAEYPADPAYTDPVITDISKIDSQTYKLELNNGATSVGPINYKITIANTVTDTSSNTITDPKYVTFRGNEQLKVVSAEAITLKTVRLTFSKPVTTASAECTGDTECSKLYKISPSLGLIESASVDANTVTIAHQQEQEGIVYSIIAANAINGDQFDNSVSIHPTSNPTGENLQAMPKDRTSFVGKGNTIDSIDDGPYFSDPFADLTSFNFAFVYRGKVYLGPNKTNVSAFRFDPNGYNSVLVTFETASKSCATATGLGYGTADTCVSDPALTNAGFNGERGIVGFNSASVIVTGNPYEMLLVGPLKDGVTFGYFTQDVDTVLDWSQISFSGTGGSNTSSIQTVYGVDDYVYLAASSRQSNQAPVVSVSRLTRTGDVISILSSADMSIRSVDDLGAQGGNPAAGSPSRPTVIGIDSILKYNSQLYMANNGGIRYSSDFTAFSSSQDSVPSTLAGTTLWLPDAPAGLEKLSPGQKGIPILLEYNGKLYMARNVASGSTYPSTQARLRGELWRCNPDPLNVETPDVCDPGDWTRIITGEETDLVSTGAVAISMLQNTTDGILYVGFDSASANGSTTGASVWRIESSEPSASSGTGHNLTEVGWSLIGVPGFRVKVGASYNNLQLTKILSQARAEDETFKYLYITAGDGINAIKVFRQRD